MKLHKGDFHKVDLEEGCPPSTEILANVPRADWSASRVCDSSSAGSTRLTKENQAEIRAHSSQLPNRDGPFQWGRSESYLLYPAYYANVWLLRFFFPGLTKPREFSQSQEHQSMPEWPSWHRFALHGTAVVHLMDTAGAA
jgi:hypothetical protein